VRNFGRDAVEIEAEGEPEVIKRFIDDVLASPPPHARVNEVHTTSIPIEGTNGFSIAPSVM
jgi:hydrogenase maturation factor HypF (carbamoyltransferase family)